MQWIYRQRVINKTKKKNNHVIDGVTGWFKLNFKIENLVEL